MTKYWGGKARLGKDIAKTMLEMIDENSNKFDLYWEPFIGMGGVMRHMVSPLLEYDSKIQLFASDLNEGVVNFWNYLKQGESFDDVLDFSTDDLEHLKSTKDMHTPYHTLVGYSCGFHGMYFSGKICEDYAKPLLKSALKSIDHVRDQMSVPDYHHSDFFSMAENYTPRNAIIYLDPPYVERFINKNEVWSHKKDEFDTEEFWETLDDWSNPKLGNLIFVSESAAPDNWVPVWSKDWSNKNSNKQSTKINREEHLYCNIETLDNIF
jgi:site-specific DNA-adenine methylase